MKTENFDEFMIKIVEEGIPSGVKILKINHSQFEFSSEYTVYVLYKDVVVVEKKITNMGRNQFFSVLAESISKKIKMYESLCSSEYSVVHYVYLMTSLNILYNKCWSEVSDLCAENVGDRLKDFLSKASEGKSMSFHQKYKMAISSFVPNYLGLKGSFDEEFIRDFGVLGVGREEGR